MKTAPKSLHAKTLGEWQALYLASPECPDSARRNLPGIFRRFAELVGNTSDPGAVSLWDAGGLLQVWEGDLADREARGEIRSASARNYMSWGRKAILWAVENLKGRDAHTPTDILVEMDPRRHQMLVWLKENSSKIERQMGRRFLRWMDGQGKTVDDLPTEGPALTQRFACEELAAKGIKTWRQEYTAVRRSLIKLIEAGYLPAFEPHQIGWNDTAYRIHWKEIPNATLRARAETYYRVACDEAAFSERSGRVVRTATRDNRLNVLGRYVGFLVNQHGADITGLDIDGVFERNYLKAWVAFLQKRREGELTGGIQGSLNHLQQLAVSFLGLPKDRFERLISDKHVVHNPKAERVPTLDEYHALLDALYEGARDPAVWRSRREQMSAFRLHAMLTVLNNCPLRAAALCSLELDRHLKRDPGTGAWQITLSSDETKGKRPFTFPLSDHSRPILDHFVTQVRPALLNGTTSVYAFPTANGKSVPPSSFSTTLKAWDARVRGIPQDRAMTPHRIRDMVTATCVTCLPNKGSLVAQTLLQHANISTLDKHYLDPVARAAIQRNERLYDWVVKETLEEEDIRKILAEARQNQNDWRRFRKAVDALG